ncbi:MAG: hypothetical protein IJ418_06680, partial [Clostridia bacterium]|nr:hypothetical protein [Clostridia bacterium]
EGAIKNLFRIKKLFVLIRHVEASLLREGDHPKDGGRSDAGLQCPHTSKSLRNLISLVFIKKTAEAIFSHATS